MDGMSPRLQGRVQNDFRAAGSADDVDDVERLDGTS